jgi:hypothetical protein
MTKCLRKINLREKRLMSAVVSYISVASGFVMRQNIMAGSMWQSKATHFIGSREAKREEGAKDPDISFKSIPP